MLNDVLRLRIFPSGVRVRTLKLMGISAGRCEIRPRVRITGPALTLGTGVFVNSGCTLECQGGITLEDDVALAPNVFLGTVGHEIGPSHRRQGKAVRQPIVVGAGTWIGAHSVVLPGVTIGSGCVIAAGAVVAADCAPHGLYAGVPARRLRDLETEEPGGEQEPVSP